LSKESLGAADLVPDAVDPVGTYVFALGVD